MGHQKWEKKKAKEAEEWITGNGLIDYGGATLGAYCTAMDISDQTHYRWMEEHVEYVDAIKRGKEQYKETLKRDAVESLKTLVKGTTLVEEKKYKDDEGNVVKSAVKYVKVLPNTAAVIFALTNLDPEHWQNKQSNETKLNAEGIQVVFNQSTGAEARTTEDE